MSRLWLHLRQGTLTLLANERLVDMRDHPTPCDGSLDERVQLLVPPDGKLQVPGGDPLNLQVLTGIASQLEHLKFQFNNTTMSILQSKPQQ